MPSRRQRRATGLPTSQAGRRAGWTAVRHEAQLALRVGLDTGSRTPPHTHTGKAAAAEVADETNPGRLCSAGPACTATAAATVLGASGRRRSPMHAVPRNGPGANRSGGGGGGGAARGGAARSKDYARNSNPDGKRFAVRPTRPSRRSWARRRGAAARQRSRGGSRPGATTARRAGGAAGGAVSSRGRGPAGPAGAMLADSLPEQGGPRPRSSASSTSSPAQSCPGHCLLRARGPAAARQSRVAEAGTARRRRCPAPASPPPPASRPSPSRAGPSEWTS